MGLPGTLPDLCVSWFRAVPESGSLFFGGHKHFQNQAAFLFGGRKQFPNIGSVSGSHGFGSRPSSSNEHANIQPSESLAPNVVEPSDHPDPEEFFSCEENEDAFGWGTSSFA